MDYVRRFYISSLLHLTFYSGFYLIYLQSLSLSKSQIGFLIGLSLILVTIFEIPTGIVADKISKKTSVLLSKILLIPGTLLLYLANSFWHVLFATIFNSLAVAFLTGAETGWLYELLSRDGRRDEYPKIYGRLRAFEMAGSFLGATLGGFIARLLSMRVAILLSVPFILISFLIMLTIPSDTTKSKLPYGYHLIETFRFLRSSRVLALLFAYASLIGLSLASFTSFMQLYFYEFMPSILGVSWLSGLYTLINGISWYVDVGENRRKVLYVYSPILIPGLTLLAGLSSWFGFLTLVLGSLLFAQAFKEWQRAFQGAIPDDKRATLGSFYSLFASLINGIYISILGTIFGKIGIRAGLVVVSLMFLGAGLVVRKHIPME
ncbi:MFS transporter [Pyrococcus kukulkanii]|uniref:MFS transporter permease n=1 Tax=Pyrococcus kukulkanii TaxID=1609559 RepID=A0A127BAJ2_9EURY|nr:MFS transporter [Pyrococcus kukulkanii]AMM53819.1 MFS transporter permease [Pyrococcus kukulkanii]